MKFKSPTVRNAVSELHLSCAADFKDPWAEVSLSAEITDPEGATRVVPAFWDGGRTWRVRYSSEVEGVHLWQLVVQAERETGLEGRTGELIVAGNDGTNPLLSHGALEVAAEGRHLAHADGTPFLWLGDTWWLATTARFRWPDVFRRLADDRARKGFNVLQIAAGFLPEIEMSSRMIESEGGLPWIGEKPGTVNPAYWTVPDLKIAYLVELGIVPCIFGAWAYWADLLGLEGAKRHWRYLVARYGAYPVVWCIAGEVDLLRQRGSDQPDPAATVAQIAIWEELSDFVRRIDPFDRLRTVHPGTETAFASSEAFSSRDSFDFDMLQTGHFGSESVPRGMEHLKAALAHGDKPVLNGESSYEGHFGSNWQDVQRFLFWTHLLSGTAGHTYGTVAISCFNSRTDRLESNTYLDRVGSDPWEDAIDWPGAIQLGVGKKILEGIDWSSLRPCQEAVSPRAGPADWFLPYAARTRDGGLLVYIPSPVLVKESERARLGQLELTGLTPRAGHRASFIDPRSGRELPSLEFIATGAGTYLLESDWWWIAPTGEDWVLSVSPEGRASSQERHGRQPPQR